MGLFNREKFIVSDFEIIKEQCKEISLKNLAIETCVGLIANTVTQVPFVVKNKGKIHKDNIYYLLNVKPNKNQNAVQFWTTAIRRMINEGECLILFLGDEMFIAENFTVHDNVSTREYRFDNISIGSIALTQSFSSSDVLYFKLSNERLDSLIKKLDNDYIELFSNVLEFQKKARQVRATYKMKSVNSKEKDAVSKLQNYIDKVTTAFRKNTYSVVPLQLDDEYKEYTSNNAGEKGVDELSKLTNIYVDDVAMALHIPPQILHGDMSDIGVHNDNFIKYCIKPFLNLITSELTGKIFRRKEILEGSCVTFNVLPLTVRNVFDVAERMDKFIQDGVFTVNDVLEELGRERVDDPECDKRYITKNIDTLKGGEEVEQQAENTL